MELIPNRALFVIAYKFEDDTKIKQLVDSFSSVGMSRLLKSEVSISFLNKNENPKEDIIKVIIRLSDIAFSKRDILELVFEHNGNICFCRIKKKGNLKLNLRELKCALQIE